MADRSHKLNYGQTEKQPMLRAVRSGWLSRFLRGAELILFFFSLCWQRQWNDLDRSIDWFVIVFMFRQIDSSNSTATTVVDRSAATASASAMELRLIAAAAAAAKEQKRHTKIEYYVFVCEFWTSGRHILSDFKVLITVSDSYTIELLNRPTFNLG